MECIDFKNEIIVDLTPEQEKHLAVCLRCRLQWEDSALERTIIHTPFDAANEPVVDLTDKPPTASWVNPEFLLKLREAKKLQNSANAGAMDKVDKLLAKLYPANIELKKKLCDIAGRIRSQLHPAPKDFDERFAAAISLFPEDETVKMSKEELTGKISDRIRIKVDQNKK